MLPRRGYVFLVLILVSRRILLVSTYSRALHTSPIVLRRPINRRDVASDAHRPKGKEPRWAGHATRLAGNRGYSTALNSRRLAGKVAVITGGASGIGKATAEEFVKNGAKVVLADVQDDLGHALAAKLGADSASYTRCDVTDEAQVAAAVDLAVSRHGNLDIMFNNAGIPGSPARPPLASLDLADFDTVMAMMPAPPPRSPRRPSPSPTLSRHYVEQVVGGRG
nr:momilactone A synthase-like [Lolium perenne]